MQVSEIGIFLQVNLPQALFLCCVFEHKSATLKRYTFITFTDLKVAALLKKVGLLSNKFYMVLSTWSF